MSTEPLVSTGDLAAALGVSIKTIQRYRTQEIIKPDVILSNGHARWDLAKVREALSRPRTQEP